MVHLARYRRDDDIGWGLVAGDGLAPLEGSYRSTADLISGASSDWQSAAERTATVALNDVTVLSPVTTPCRVMCLGANYRQHAIESGMDPDRRAFNVFFDKTDASVTGPDMPVVRPAHVQLLDYEIELALVMRAEVTQPVTVTAANLHEYVFGVTPRLVAAPRAPPRRNASAARSSG